MKTIEFFGGTLGMLCIILIIINLIGIMFLLLKGIVKGFIKEMKNHGN